MISHIEAFIPETSTGTTRYSTYNKILFEWPKKQTSNPNQLLKYSRTKEGRIGGGNRREGREEGFGKKVSGGQEGVTSPLS